MKKLEIKPYQDSTSLIYSIIFLIVGALLFTNPGGIVEFISYIIGAFLLIIALFKLIHYYRMKSKDIVPNSIDLTTGIICLILGIVFIICRSAIETAIRYIIGGWILFSGISRLVSSFQIKGSKFKSLLIVSILMILCGLYVILESNLVFQMIGLFIMIYSIIEIVGYILYSKE